MTARIWVRGLFLIALLSTLSAWWATSGSRFRGAARARLEALEKGDKAVHIGPLVYHRTEMEVVVEPRLLGPDARRWKHVRPMYADPIPVIADFRDQLAERGVELVVLPVPSRPWIRPDFMHDGGIPPLPWPAAAPYYEVVDALRAEGIEAVDALAPMQRAAMLDPKIVSPKDEHWTNAGMRHVARSLADRLEQLDLAEGPALRTEVELESHARTPLMAARVGEDLGREVSHVRRVKNVDGTPDAWRRPDAPILLMGDSFSGWFSDWNADLVRQLRHELQRDVDGFVVHGGGSTRVREELSRELQIDPELLGRKRVVVWEFAVAGVLTDEWKPVSSLSRLRASRGCARCRPCLETPFSSVARGPRHG